MTGFISSPRFVQHDTGPHHPERPDRIRAIHRAVRQAGLISSPDPFPGFRLDLGIQKIGVQSLKEINPIPADERWLELVHTKGHIERVQHVCELGGGVLDQGDTPVGSNSFELALLSLGGILRACDAVVNAEVTNAFAAGRPPGHHADPERAMGFCLFSNVAIAARYLQKKHGIGKVAIVDFDVHHGNGTQASLEEDRSIFFVSIHQDPRTCYPGSGFEREIGVGQGRGFTMNVPMMPGLGDAEYAQAFNQRILPAVDQFQPEFLLLSAGFDAHAQDPLAQMELTDDGFAQITRMLVDRSRIWCQSRLVSALEGGYNLQALGRSVVRHLLELDR